jgi:hypothetical protein
MREADANNLRVLAGYYGSEPAAGLDAIVDVIIGRTSIADTSGDRDAVRAVLTLAAGSPTFLAFRFQDSVHVDTLERMRAAAGACHPTKNADAITEIVIKDIRHTMFPPYGSRPADVGEPDPRSWARQWWDTHVHRS